VKISLQVNNNNPKLDKAKPKCYKYARAGMLLRRINQTHQVFCIKLILSLAFMSPDHLGLVVSKFSAKKKHEFDY